MATYSVMAGTAAAGSRLPSQAVTVSGDDVAPRNGVMPKAISGHVYDINGTAVVGATVDLYRQIDNKRVRTTTSGVGGAYSFSRDPNDAYTYYTVAYSIAGGSTQVHGVSDRGLVPA